MTDNASNASNPPIPPLKETLDDRLYEVECAMDEAILALASPDDVDRVALAALVNRLISATMTLREVRPKIADALGICAEETL